jgi:hypothetical protein
MLSFSRPVADVLLGDAGIIRFPYQNGQLLISARKRRTDQS